VEKVVNPIRVVLDYLALRRSVYAAQGCGDVRFYPHPVGNIPSERMPVLMASPINLATQPFGMPDIFVETYRFELYGFVIDPDPERANELRWIFGATTLRLLAELPHYLNAEGHTFYTQEHWMPSVEFTQTMIGNSPVDAWVAPLVLQKIVQYTPLAINEQPIVRHEPY